MSRGVWNASWAGICAALAGITAKIAQAPESPPAFVRLSHYYIPSDYTHLLVRGLFVAAAIMFNSLMLTLTAKAMQLCPTTVVAVVITSAANFLFTGFVGTLLLGEHVGFIGIIGMIFIQIGILILVMEKEKID